ncbi:MAG TPA: TRAP transporter large permease [Reyranella sp.]|nr:TRAP transporter large permease [Reyranella sp.]HTY67808.1 TRAP transporter large permease [Alphaproteobacteria bacterium]
MTPQIIGLVGFAVLVALIFLRVPVAVALGAVGTVGYAVLDGWPAALLVLGKAPFSFASAYDLSVVPLFVLMGAVAAHSGMATELFQSINVMFSGRRGTLATATVGACAALGAVSGSSLAMVATMSHVAVPEMRRANYDDRLALGSAVAGGTLGILIPPSVMLIFYGIIAVQSIPKLFAAGMIPGLLLAALQIGVVKAITWFRPEWAPATKPAAFAERLKASIGMWKLLFIFFLSIGGIYAGWFSPTEAAAVGTFATIVLAAASRELTLEQLTDAIVESSRTTAMLFFILLGAIMFSYFIVQTQIAPSLAHWVTALRLPGLGVMLFIIVFYILLGSFLESLTMILITVPVFAPLAQELGFSLIWFGVLLVVLIEVGLIHPPMGMNLFVLQSQVDDVKLGQLYIGSAYFLVANAILIALLLAFPELALWLPRVLY